MDLLQAIVLGVTQGLTEFLPISSSGHLIIVPWLFGWDSAGLAFDAALHLGTLVAVFTYFRHDILEMLRAVPVALRHPVESLRYEPTVSDAVSADPSVRRSLSAKLGLLIILGSIPGGVIGLAAQSSIESYFHDDPVSDRAVATIAVMLIVFGLVLYWADLRGSKSRKLRSMAVRDTVVIGFAQALALIPGVSRSGITLTAGLTRGFDRADAARFSFLLGIPLITLAGAKGVFDIIEASPDTHDILMLAAGMISASITGFLAIWGLLRYLSQSSTRVFAIYRLVVGLGVLLLLATGIR